MANEIIKDADATATVLENAILAAVIPAQVMLPLMLQRTLGPGESVKQFIIDPAADSAAAVNEATDLTNTAVNPTKVQLTPGEVGIMYTVTDVSGRKSLQNIPQITSRGVRACIKKWETDCTALFSGLTANTAIGTSGTNFSFANLQAAILSLLTADTPGPFVFVGHEVQASDLAADIAASSAALWGNSSVAAQRGLFGENTSNPSGYRGTVLGVDIFASTTCPTANAGADRSGALFRMPVDDEDGAAFAIVWSKMLGVELQRDASLRATEVVLVSDYAVGEVRDAFGVNIVTDA